MQPTKKALAALSLSLLGTLANAGESGRSYTPIVGYDDKNGALYGAAAFAYQDGRPGYNGGLYGVSNGRDFHAATLSVEKRPAQGLDLALRSTLARSFDNYYGEGDQTSTDGALVLKQDTLDANASAMLRLKDDRWAVGPSVSVKGRREQAVTRLEDGSKVEHRAFLDSADPAFGLRAAFDDRDSNMSSTKGRLVAVDVRALPSKIAFADGAQDAYQAQAEWRQFQTLGSHAVLAHRLAGGASLGEPGYADRYSLGGTGQLRGFQDNRFRGRQFYCVQEEVRVPVWKAVSLASSVDLGDVGDGKLSHPRHSVQAGLRAGLPPSYGMKARLDVGYGDAGEKSLALQFGETF